MAILAFILTLLSAVVMGAHFLRAGWTAVAVACLAVPFLVLVRRGWVVRALQVVLILWALEWVRTLVVLANVRAEAGQPWMRMAIILALVAGVNVLAVAVLEVLRRRRGRR